MNFINFNLLDNHPFFKSSQIQEMTLHLNTELGISFSTCELVKRDNFSYDLLFDNSFDYISKIELDLITKKPKVSIKSNKILDSAINNYMENFIRQVDVILKKKSQSSFYISINIDSNFELNYTVCIFSHYCTFLAYLDKIDVVNKDYTKLKISFSKTPICNKLYPDYSSSDMIENFEHLVTLLNIEEI